MTDGDRDLQREKRSHATRGVPPRWEIVPPSTAPAVCTGFQKPGGSCRARIFWIERPRIKAGKAQPGTKTRVPVDCAVDGGEEPTSTKEGRGHSHYTTCPDARSF